MVFCWSFKPKTIKDMTLNLRIFKWVLLISLKITIATKIGKKSTLFLRKCYQKFLEIISYYLYYTLCIVIYNYNIKIAQYKILNVNLLY